MKTFKFNLCNTPYQFNIEVDEENSNLIITKYKLQIIELDRRTGQFKHYKTSFAGNSLAIWNFIKDFLHIVPSFESDKERVLMAFDEYFN